MIPDAASPCTSPSRGGRKSISMVCCGARIAMGTGRPKGPGMGDQTLRAAVCVLTSVSKGCKGEVAAGGDICSRDTSRRDRRAQTNSVSVKGSLHLNDHGFPERVAKSKRTIHPKAQAPLSSGVPKGSVDVGGRLARASFLLASLSEIFRPVYCSTRLCVRKSEDWHSSVADNF